jgi:hypothetical protein
MRGRSRRPREGVTIDCVLHIAKPALFEFIKSLAIVGEDGVLAG